MNYERYIPVSEQIENILFQRIQAGAYSPQERLPSEAQLCKEFNVSRATVRTALSALSARGLLVKKPGLGTFLDLNSTQNRLVAGLEQLESVVGMAQRQGLNVHHSDLSIEPVPADPFLSERLCVEPGSPVVAIRRTISVDGQPVSYHDDYVPEKFLLWNQVNELFTGSVLDLLNQFHTPAITEADTEITSVNAEYKLCERLGVPRHRSLILLRETLYDEDGTVVEFSENYFVPDRVCLRVVRKNSFS
jgi:GntR family transcriptional regulator